MKDTREPYPMTKKRKTIQLDCRRSNCKYYVKGGDCTANAPAITLSESICPETGQPYFMCWSAEWDGKWSTEDSEGT